MLPVSLQLCVLWNYFPDRQKVFFLSLGLGRFLLITGIYVSSQNNCKTTRPQMDGQSPQVESK